MSKCVVQAGMNQFEFKFSLPKFNISIFLFRHEYQTSTSIKKLIESEARFLRALTLPLVKLPVLLKRIECIINADIIPENRAAPLKHVN